MSTTTVVAEAQPHLQALKLEASSLDRHGYLFGQHLAQSMSPLLHNVIYRHLGLKWGQIRLDSTDMDLFLRLIRHPDFYGASVTMPHKLTILPHLDALTEECRAIGACNTIFLRPPPPSTPTAPPLLVGANTDAIGVRDAFLHNVPSAHTTLHSRPALVIGGGGAARSAVFALQTWLRASAVYMVNRDDGEVAAVVAECRARGFGRLLRHVRTVGEAAALEAPGAVVSCVPDEEPRTDGERAARAVVEVFLRKGRKGAVLEMCYNPSPYTAFGKLAEREGWQVILGTEALIWQGIEQDKYWTGRELEPSTVKAVQKAIADKLSGR